MDFASIATALGMGALNMLQGKPFSGITDNVLIANGTAGYVLPLSWGLSGALDSKDMDWEKGYTDGYQIQATMEWLDFGEDATDTVGTTGSCVEALTDEDVQFEEEKDGHPVVCTLVTVDGNTATDMKAVSWNLDQWGGSGVTATPANFGTPVPGGAIFGKDMGYSSKKDQVVEEAEEAVDDGVDDAAEAIEDAFQDDFGEEERELQEFPSEAEEEEREEDQDFGEKVVDTLKKKKKYLSYHWYQPKAAESYSGLRRYGQGTHVVAYALNLQVDADQPFVANPIGEMQILKNATALASSIATLTAVMLAF